MTNLPLVDFLIAEYRKELEEHNECRKEKGEPPIDIEHAIKSTKVFQQFATRYLDKNRPSTIQHLDGNYRLTLTNGEEVLICPASGAEERPGSMQPAHAVPVTGRDSIGSVDFGDGAIPLVNQEQNQSPNVVDMGK